MAGRSGLDGRPTSVILSPTYVGIGETPLQIIKIARRYTENKRGEHHYGIGSGGAEEIGGPVGRPRWKYGTQFGRRIRQRVALSRLRYFRSSGNLGVRGDRVPATARYVADSRRARNLQGNPAIATRLAGRRQTGARSDSGCGTSDGRYAHRRFGARMRSARSCRSQRAGGTRNRGSSVGVARIDSTVLVPLRASWRSEE